MSTHAVEHPSSHFARSLPAHVRRCCATRPPDGPQILPVTYGVVGGDIVFRTSPYGVLAQLTHPTQVAFEIDDIDQTHGAGWSVLVRGQAQAVMAPHELVSLWTQPGIVPWAPGIRNLWIGTSVTAISGRRVKAPYAG